jgi:hypothetical protein
VTAIASHPVTNVVYGIRTGPTELVRIDGTQVTGLFTLPVTTGATTPVGFDIADDGTGLLSITFGTGTAVFGLALDTGATALRGTVANGTNAVAGLTVAPADPPPGPPRPTKLEFTRIAPTADEEIVSVTTRLTTADDGAPLPNKTVSVRIEATTVDGVTDGTGETTVLLPTLPIPVVVFADFRGDAAYLGSMTSGDFVSVSIGAQGQFVVSPAGGAFAANGGSGTLNVTTFPPGAPWTASSNDPSMVEIPSGGSTGDGSRAYLVARHLDVLAGRQGALAIAGATVPILQGAAFRDVPETDPFYTFIGKLSARGVTSGMGGGNYGPDQPITRGQMAVFVIRALGEPDPPPGMQSFTDVPPTHPFFPFIQQMKERGITSGCSATAYCPDDPVTRGQMAVFMIRALQQRGLSDSSSSTPYFTDVPPTQPFFPFIQKMKELGITSGCTMTTYCPGAAVTRGQMAVFIVRAFFP